MREGGIPEELIRFLESPGGHSLIVKGAAGTGKTTFALQLTEELGNVLNSHYMTIRVSDTSLYNQFPWLRERMQASDILPREKTFLKTLNSISVHQEKEAEVSLEIRVKSGKRPLKAGKWTEGQVQKVDRTELQKLEGRIEMGEEGEETLYDKVGEGEVSKDSLIFDLGSDLPEVDIAYDAVERNLPEKTLVLIDSIDALSERYGIHPSKLINTLQKDLVENSKANVVYVLESSVESRLDYLGDGVVSFHDQDHEGRRLRVMFIEKLRGCEIKQHKYIYTLENGRIKAFSIRPPEIPVEIKRWTPVADPSSDVVSTGNEELDNIIEGLPRGKIVAIEVGSNVSSYYTDSLKTALIANFVSHGRGVAFVPSKKATSEIVKEYVAPYIGSDAFEDYVRVFESSPLGSLEGSRNALQMEGSNVETDLKWSNVEYRLPKAKHPFLSLMAFDTLESVYGDEVIEEMSGHLSTVRRNKDIFLGISTPTTMSTQRLANLAHVHIKIQNVGGSIVLFGEKPHTELFDLSFDQSKGCPKARLTPIL